VTGSMKIMAASGRIAEVLRSLGNGKDAPFPANARRDKE